jgi:hypothetical protein
MEAGGPWGAGVTVTVNGVLAIAWLDGSPGTLMRNTSVPVPNTASVIEYVPAALTEPTSIAWKPVPMAFWRSR